MELLNGLKEKIKGKNIKIVLPEGYEPRILEAASRLSKEQILQPVLIGDPYKIRAIARANNYDVAGIEIIDPKNYADLPKMIETFLDIRKGKVDVRDAVKLMLDENYFGTMLTHMGYTAGMVSGAVHSTGDTVRPALQIIKTKPGVTRTSGFFVMVKEDAKYIFADCAINIELDAEGLAGVAIESAKSAKMFGIDPRVAMLSFSTKGSAKHELAEKVEEATRLAKAMNPDLPLDGELQFDAAIVPSVGDQKAPGSKVAGNANVFVFPSLEAGNIGYKIAQRLGGYEALGPILQGLNKPVTDLSRGCNSEDVYKLCIITACQSIME